MRWERVNSLPGYVYFDHSVHVAKGIGCTTCHGPIDTMRLTRQTAPLTMQWCLDCHRNPAASVRPREAVFDPEWRAPPDQIEQGRKLMAAYHIQVDHLTDCSRCHR
jgi:Cytochrome c7 and related cytochrome c